jgi:hypothetical protein
MGLKVWPKDTLFEFVPETEKTLLEDDSEYKPITILHVQMDGAVSAAYRSEMSKYVKQNQEVSGRGGTSKISTSTDADMRALRNLDIKYACMIVRKATNFELVAESTEYPNSSQEWCDDEKTLKVLIESMPEEWVSELIISARNISELTPYEKKS